MIPAMISLGLAAATSPRPQGIRRIPLAISARGQRAAGALLAYVLANFFFCIFRLHDGGPDLHAGEFVKKKRGQPALRISEEEYWSLRRAELRVMTGHAVVFSSVAVLHFLGLRRRGRRAAP
jgi:hypothetical protein